MTAELDVIVVGAGIVGAACAAAFARDGMRVAVVDEAAPGSGATAAAMGHIVAMNDSPAQFALTNYAQELWAKLAEHLPASAEFRRPGTLWLAADQEEMGEVERRHALFTDAGVTAKILTADQVHAEEPALRSDLAGGLLMPRDAVVSAPAVAGTLHRRAQQDGAMLITGRVVQIGGGRVRLADGREWRTRRIVNAAGVCAAALTPGTGIRARKGHLALTEPCPGLLRRQVVELGYLKTAHDLEADSVAFNVQPRVSGQLLIGSSRQFGVESDAVEAAIMEKMMQRAVAYMQVLANCRMQRAWTGFRAATPDKLPLIGPLPDDGTVFLAAGHEGLGITTSLATAELLSSLFRGSAPAIPIEPYLPGRPASH